MDRDGLLLGLLVAHVIDPKVGHEPLGSVPDWGNKNQWPGTTAVVSGMRQHEELLKNS